MPKGTILLLLLSFVEIHALQIKIVQPEANMPYGDTLYIVDSQIISDLIPA